MLFEMVDGQQALCDAGLYPGWRASDVHGVARSPPKDASQSDFIFQSAPPRPAGSRRPHGVHTATPEELLDEMCEVYRVEPGAAW
jgi:hypothetical protein